MCTDGRVLIATAAQSRPARGSDAGISKRAVEGVPKAPLFRAFRCALEVDEIK